MVKSTCIGAILSCVFLSGCIGNSLKPTDVYRTNAKQTQQVQQGTVVGVYDITIKGNDTASQAVGAGLGGYAANRATRNANDVTQVAATTAGAIVGTIVGDTFSDMVLDKSGLNVVIRLDSGKTVAISQQTDSRATINNGDRVWVIGNPNNVRVIKQK